jgi:hypothetical protein
MRVGTFERDWNVFVGKLAVQTTPDPSYSGGEMVTIVVSDSQI